MTKPASAKLSASEQIAADLGWPAKSTYARVKFLGLLATCTRCGGSGRFSYNTFDGDRCFGCHGAGKVAPKYSRKLVAELRAREAAGALAPYFERCARARAARAMLPAILAEARVAYKRIADSYDAAYRAIYQTGEVASGHLIGTPISDAQDRANMTYWRDDRNDGRSGSALIQGPTFLAVCEIERLAKEGQLDPEVAADMLRDRIARLNSITW